MSRNGSGGYSLLSNSWNPAVNGISATAADWQALINDVAAAVQQSISADGQTPITGNLQMGGNKLTGLAAGSGTGQSLRFEQLFSQGTLTDIASAATLDIGAQLTNFLRVTGTTGITSFGVNYNGPRFLIFSGAVLLTHSSSLVLPGAANITTAANDALIAIPISGGWQVVAYTRAAGIPAIAGPLASSGITGAAASGAVTASGLTQTTGRLLGRTTASTGAIEEISTGAALTLASGSINVADAGITPAKLSQPLTSATAVNTTSGTSIDFTGIPAWVKRITVMFNSVSTSGASQCQIQIGAGSVVTTGYIGYGQGFSGGGTATSSVTTGLIGFNSTVEASVVARTGHAVLTLVGSNTWIYSSVMTGQNTQIMGFGAGSLALGGTLDRVRLTTVNGTDTFDSGSINIMYE